MDQISPAVANRAFDTRRLRLSTLTNTRWLAVAGQAAAITFVAGYLDFDVPLVATFAMVAASAVFNMVLTLQFPANQRVEPVGVVAIFAFDLVQLSALLYFTGGLENPFSVLLVVPVLISAASLPMRHTAALGCIAFAAASVLAIWHLPLPWYPGRDPLIPPLFVAGVWVAVICSLAFTAFYIYRVANEARRLSDALAATELVMQRELHLSALDGLAAAAAHELGTPLSTISLVVKEMDRAVTDPGDLKDDIRLLRTQADRCREILGRLSTLQATSEEQIMRLPLMSLIEEVVAPHREFGVDIAVKKDDCTGPEPVTRRNPGILYGLGNIVENAVDFARQDVCIAVSWDADQVTMVVHDDGIGFSAEHLERLGEPDIASLIGGPSERRGGQGLGLGVFIAKTLLERSGATVRFANGPHPGEGARVIVIWPRKSIEGIIA